MSSNSFKNEITCKPFTYKSYMYIHLHVCKQMTDGKLLLLHRNTWNHLTVVYLCQTELVEIELFICVKKGFGIK